MMITSKEVLCALTILLVASSKSNAVTHEDLSDYKLRLEDVIDDEVFSELNEILSDESTTEDGSAKVQSANPKFFGRKDDDEEDSDELGMDTITIIWYLSTFTALFGFFILMACTDNTCSRRRTSKPVEEHDPTPSPCPSYKNFAPPSYGSVMKKLKDQKIYIVPVHEGNNSFFSNPVSDATSAQQTAAADTAVDIEKSEAITVAR